MTFSLAENQFSGRTCFYTIRPWCCAQGCLGSGFLGRGVFLGSGRVLGWKYLAGASLLHFGLGIGLSIGTGKAGAMVGPLLGWIVEFS